MTPVPDSPLQQLRDQLKQTDQNLESHRQLLDKLEEEYADLVQRVFGLGQTITDLADGLSQFENATMAKVLVLETRVLVLEAQPKK